MKQLALDIAASPAPTLDNFVSGRNLELLMTLDAFARGNGARFVYIWGEDGSGRSHLMRAVLAAARGIGRAALVLRSPAEFEVVPGALVIADDVHRLDDQAQIALFDLYNRLRSDTGALLASGDAAPAHLATREDLKTRLAAGLVYQVHALNDEEKAATLACHAQARGFALTKEVADYLLQHTRRDLPSLLALLDALDRYSLAAKRAITVSLVRQLLDE